MNVTTETLINMLKKVIELLKIEENDRVELAINILTLLINYIGAQNIADAVEDGLESLMERVSSLILGEGDLTAEERADLLAQTRTQLDEVFAKMAES